MRLISPATGIFGHGGSRLVPFLVKPGIRATHVKDRNKENDLVLRTLLKKSCRNQAWFGFAGGIAFTMEATDINVTADLDQASGDQRWINGNYERTINAFGVAEPSFERKEIVPLKYKF